MSPLMHGTSQHIIQENIRELMSKGHPQSAAVAIAMKHAGKSRVPPVPKPTTTPPKEPDADD